VKNGSGKVYYIFYTSLALDKNYCFYITDWSGCQQEYSFSFGIPENGEDDEDVNDNNSDIDFSVY
jgi:hypothetical protein